MCATNEEAFVIPVLLFLFSSEFLGQSWTKPGKEAAAPNIVLITKRFNEVSSPSRASSLSRDPR